MKEIEFTLNDSPTITAAPPSIDTSLDEDIQQL